MDDRALVTAMVRREPDGLDGAYRRYADRLYAYCVSVLRDSDAAADVVQETFLLASERAGQLRDPDRLRPWLYAIARHECLRVVRSRKRSAPLDEAGDVAAEPVDVTATVQAAQLRELIGSAAASLSEADREVIELSVRQGLSPAEVGSVLGLSANHAHARMSRARSQLLRALGALLVARSSTVDCPELVTLKQGWDGRLTPLLRKRISRHIESCAACTASQLEQLQPAALLPAYAGLAFAAAPALLARAGASGSSASSGSSSASSGSLTVGPDGFPRPDPTRRRLLTTAAVLVLLLLLGGGAVALAQGRPERPVSAATAPTTSAAAVVGEPEPGLVAPSGAAPPSGTVPPSAAEPPGQPPVVTDPPGPGPTTGAPYFVVAFTATVHAIPSCSGSTLTIRFSAQATAKVSLAYANWVSGPNTTRRRMEPDGTRATLFVTGIHAASVTWSIDLTAADGRTYSSPSKVLTHACV